MEQAGQQEAEIQEFLKSVKRVFMVMSGKGGVGKSTMAAGIAAALAEKGLRTGLLDIDVHGPSIARIMGLTGLALDSVNGKIQPYPYADNLKIISMQGEGYRPDGLYVVGNIVSGCPIPARNRLKQSPVPIG